MAHLLFQWTVRCSKCESFIVLKPSQALPKVCPHCGIYFEPEKEALTADDKAHTFLPAMDEYLNKIRDL